MFRPLLCLYRKYTNTYKHHMHSWWSPSNQTTKIKYIWTTNKITKKKKKQRKNYNIMEVHKHTRTHTHGNNVNKIYSVLFFFWLRCAYIPQNRVPSFPLFCYLSSSTYSFHHTKYQPTLLHTHTHTDTHASKQMVLHSVLPAYVPNSALN